MKRDEQKRGARASASASFEGTDDSDLMSAPVDLPREEAEVFFSEEKLHQDEAAPGRANVENPTERASEGQQQGGQAEERSSGGSREPEGGRFDEEAVPGDHPYSPKPKERGHGIPPHKDSTNTGPGRMSSNPAGGGGGSGSSGEQHPSGDEQNPAAAI
ncbi:hypothetical protein OEZ85_013282 [Tetradesmus obliquus]|uniref:Uncharacterized protein n=1 Tax=Tetradesmus obliquus TaxID=3088 RepID=A0ABY8U5H3_TETOB|nr:hypothetical protein OEZ85_013282 [Tetradesmus obliquus]